MAIGYPFKRHRLDWLLVHESRVQPGMRHLKSFVLDTRPADQVTFNLYTAGRFELLVGATRHELVAGQCSLDLGDATIPAGTLVIEQALEEGVRLCMQPADPKTRWTRRRVLAPAGVVTSAVDGFVFPSRGGFPIGMRAYMPVEDEMVFLVERI